VKSLLLGLWRRLRGTPGSALRAAAAVAIGLFIGCQPLYGLHLVLVLAVCVPLRLDAVLAYLAANISNPFVAPFLIFAEVEAGAYLLTGRFVAFDVEQARATGAAGFAQQLLVGSLAVGAILALVGFGLGWLIASRRSERANAKVAAGDTEAALERTRARYAGVRHADRYYVAGKLAFDPVFGLVAGLSGSFGRVLDVGCGRGQLGLFLHELGRAAEVTGLDSDARKIDVARSAFPEARFVIGDAAQLELPPADTILLVDVLHYLPLAEQDALLAAATRAVAPGGRVLVRELDADPSARSAITRFFEWCARKTGLNRGRATHYRPASDLTRALESAGLACSVQGASEHTPFANVLIVAGGALLQGAPPAPALGAPPAV
jgi:2-polyprenyl-3-methyl-5-hydroxy-6-metoxy-1,4-benzoquinol methylase